MIKFKPSKFVETETSIDFEILSFVVSKIFEINFKKNFKYQINIHKSRHADISYIYLDSKRYFTIMLDCKRDNLRYNVSSIMHELRHIVQHAHFKSDVEGNFSSFNQYYNSDVERDARKGEKLTPAVIKAYKAILESKEIFTRFELGTLLQLGVD